MTTVPARDLRIHTASVLRQVREGAAVTITVHGDAVAELHPVTSRRRAHFTRADLTELLTHQADPGLTDELAALAGDTTDDL